MKTLLTISCFLFLVCLPCFAFSETLRMSPLELKQQLSDQHLIILDARKADAYKAGHIQGALSFPVNLTYEKQQLDGKVSPPAETQKNFRLRGISRDSNVLVYDNGDLVDAARLFWVLEVYGLNRVKVLDHGYDNWLDEGYPISANEPNVAPSQYVATINHKRLASSFTTQLATRNRNQLVLDARTQSDYTGKTSSAQRFGHIPTAINIPFSQNIELEDGFASLKSIDKLTEVYAGIPKEKKIVLYCAFGRVSSANYLALRELGYDVSNYDASWNEWGNNPDLPVEK